MAFSTRFTHTSLVAIFRHNKSDRPDTTTNKPPNRTNLQLEVLVGELFAVDRLSAGAVAAGEVAALAHEVGDDAVEAGALEAETLLAGAQRAEVLRGFGDDVRAQGHLDATGRAAADLDVEKDNGVLGHLEGGWWLLVVGEKRRREGASVE